MLRKVSTTLKWGRHIEFVHLSPGPLADVIFSLAKTWPLQSISEHLKSNFSRGSVSCVRPVSGTATTVQNSIENPDQVLYNALQ